MIDIMPKVSEYKGPDVSVDSVIFQLVDGELSVLLIKRAREPFKGMWALPGGYNPAGETTHEAMSRILKAKGGLQRSQLAYIEQLYTFDTIARDPRGHCLSITYLGLGRNLIPKAGQSTQTPQFFPVSQLPDDLAYDHGDIIYYAHKRLETKILNTNVIFALLPKMFTLSQLQIAYESVLGYQLDKRNFRKKYLSLAVIHPTNELHMEGAHRPAKLFRFNQQSLESLTQNFTKSLIN